jgi:hypothetical protein
MAKALAQKPAAPAPVPDRKLEITLQPSPEAAEGLQLRQLSTSIMVVDKKSHEEALLFIRGAKQVKRRVEEHFAKLKRMATTLHRSILDMERAELGPIEEAINAAEAPVLAFQAAEKRRVDEENEKRRREAEEQARKDREAVLRKMEAAALRAEADSDALSPREMAFAVKIVMGTNEVVAAREAGYKDPSSAAARLMQTNKIIQAIASQRKAREIREQQQAERNRPLDVQTREVVRETAKVSGVRNTVTYSARVDDEQALWAAVVAGTVPSQAFKVDEVFLNSQARQLRESFESVFVGCALVKRDGIAG